MANSMIKSGVLFKWHGNILGIMIRIVLLNRLNPNITMGQGVEARKQKIHSDTGGFPARLD